MSGDGHASFAVQKSHLTASAAIGGLPGRASLMERLVLYGARTGHSLRAAIALIEAGLTFETAKLNLSFGDQYTAGFLALNPLAQVPVLAAYQGQALLWSLSQSNAIMMEAAASAPGRLLPVARLDRAKGIERFVYFITEVIAPSDAATHLDQEGLQDGARCMSALAGERIECCESFLEHYAYMTGDTFGLADISAYTWIHSVRQGLHWKNYPLLADWYARVAERPGVQLGMAAFGT